MRTTEPDKLLLRDAENLRQAATYYEQAAEQVGNAINQVISASTDIFSRGLVGDVRGIYFNDWSNWLDTYGRSSSKLYDYALTLRDAARRLQHEYEDQEREYSDYKSQQEREKAQKTTC